MIEVKRHVKNNIKRTIYTGSTGNLTNRINQHKTNKGARYTKGTEKEIRLLYTESFSSRSDAMKREYAIKKLSKIEKEELIKNYRSFPQNNQELSDE